MTARVRFLLLVALGCVAPRSQSFLTLRAPFHGRSLSTELEASSLESAVSTAAVAAAAVSKAVSMKTLEAPNLDRSFIALDANASSAGVVDEDGLPLVYNKDLIEAYWAKEKGALQARWGEFLRYSVPFLTRVVTLLIRGGTDELLKNDKALAREAREIMEQLGPTYVKLGQVLSVRPDILPQAALDELAILQDSVKPFETSVAVEVIERELGGPLGQFFSEISEAPVAAASLAQVYKAKLADNGDGDGAAAAEREGGPQYVAVKVQRPAVLDLVSKDLYVLRRAAEVYQGLVDRFAPQQRTDYVALLNEWAVGFYTELDFANEARNQQLVKSLMQEQGIRDVYVPETLDTLSTRRILVSEWVDGRKLSECDPSEIRDLIKIGQETFLTQLLQVGVFHSDPHPGNLLRLDDEAAARVGARLCLLDFGLVAKLGQGDMDAIVSAVIHCANRDYASLVDDFIALGILPGDCDRAKVIPLMDKALTPYVMGGGAKRYEAELKKMYGFDAVASDDVGAAVGNAVGGFQAMTQDLLTVLNDIPFSIPPYFALIGRAVVTLEGVALQGDPDYGIITEAYPFVARKLLREDRPEIQRALTEVLYASPASYSSSSSSSSSAAGFSANRLAALVNAAMGVAARNNEGTFIDLDAVPDDAATLDEVISYLLSGDGAAASLWSLLEPEIEGGADLLLRQALRKTAATAFANLPQPPRLFGAPLGGGLFPAPQDVPAPLVLPQGLRTAMQQSFPAMAVASFTASGGSGGGARLVMTTPATLVETLAPPLTRAEELLALQLTDLVAGLLGEDAAMVVRGEGLTRPDAVSRLGASLLDVLLLTEETVGGGRPSAGGTDQQRAELLPDDNQQRHEASTAPTAPLSVPPALRGALQLLRNFLPTATSGTAEGGESLPEGGLKVKQVSTTMGNLSDAEKERGAAIIRRVVDRLLYKLDDRLSSLQ